MAVRKQRATTSKLYVMDQDYNKVLTEAKRLHRQDGEFYIGENNNIYSSITKSDYETYNYDTYKLEHWIFNKKWIKQ